MKRLTTEWIAKAEEDHLVAVELGLSLKLTPYNAICFHCQQAGEKWLKSRLCEDGIPFSKTHDLGSLLHQLTPTYPDWFYLIRAAENLSSYAINMRYPGDSANREDMEQALLDMCAVRDQVRKSFGLA
jgi:HEPN domain-containing protein